jgi:hypothetical protein
MNPTKSGYAYFSFYDKFFAKYSFNGAGQNRNFVRCTLFSRVCRGVWRHLSSR